MLEDCCVIYIEQVVFAYLQSLFKGQRDCVRTRALWSNRRPRRYTPILYARLDGRSKDLTICNFEQKHCCLESALLSEICSFDKYEPRVLGNLTPTIERSFYFALIIGNERDIVKQVLFGHESCEFPGAFQPLKDPGACVVPANRLTRMGSPPLSIDYSQDYNTCSCYEQHGDEC